MRRGLALLLLAGCLAAGVLSAALLAATPSATAEVGTTGTTTTAPPATTTTTTTTTTVAPTTTVPAVEVAVAPADRPVKVPKDPYAFEQLKKIGTIEIRKIGLLHTLYEGITLRTIDHGPSHWPGSAMPGQRGNAVFAGHRVTHSKPFRNIDKLVPGDEVIFDIGGKRSVYRMTSSKIVTPKALDIVNPTPTPTATLFACHPPGSAKFRYVVLLALVEDTSAPPATNAEPPPPQPATGESLPADPGL